MKYVKAFIGVFLLICLDQYTKYIVVQRLELFTYHPILGDIFGLYYLENKGMAWGMFQNKQIPFLILTVFVLIALGYCFVKLSKDIKFLPINICIQFLMAGAIGNMIDRIFHGETLFQGAVIDFLYIKLIDFPVFNLADIFVTCSIAVLVLLLLFRYKEDDFQNVFSSKQKITDDLKILNDTDNNKNMNRLNSETTNEVNIIENSKSDVINIDDLFNDENREDEDE